jgi:putative transposase
MEYQRDEHRVHLVVYHLVFCPKRRRRVLVGQLAEDCKTLISEKCRQKGWELLSLAVQPDHVHVFVRVFPTNSPAEVVKELKGSTAHELRSKYPDLLKLPCLWTRSYFASTAGNISAESIASYVEAQKGL